MGSFSITHWLILLVVVVVVFGTSKLRNAGKDLGGAVKGFKEAVKDENTEHAKKQVVSLVIQGASLVFISVWTYQGKPLSGIPLIRY